MTTRLAFAPRIGVLETPRAMLRRAATWRGGGAPLAEALVNVAVLVGWLAVDVAMIGTVLHAL